MINMTSTIWFVDFKLQQELCRIQGSHSGGYGYVEYYLLGYTHNTI
jgi:hypothetical protein